MEGQSGEEVMLHGLMSQIEGLVPSLHVHTLQVVSAWPENGEVKFRSQYLSKSLTSYQGAQDFFIYKGSRNEDPTVERSLLFDDYEDGPIWAGEPWHRPISTKPGSQDFAYDREEFGGTSTQTLMAKSPVELGTKLSQWNGILCDQFENLNGFAAWVTQDHQHEISVGNSIKIVSSCFLIFEGKKPDEKNLFKISKLVRSHLIHLLTEQFVRRIAETENGYRELFKDFFARYEPSLVFHDDVKKQAIAVNGPLRAGLPVCIEGRSGTGKLAVARILVESVATYLASKPSGRTDLGEMVLHGSSGSFVQDLELAISKSHADRAPYAYMLDDIHLLDRSSQLKLADILYRIDREISSGSEVLTYILCTLAPDADQLMRDGVLCPELHGRISTFSICLPTISQRLLPLDEEERVSLFQRMIDGQRKQLSGYFLGDLQAICRERIVELSKLQWPGNYLEFRQFILKDAFSGAGS